MRSNFDFNAFPGSFFSVNIGSRKDFRAYRFYWGQNLGQRCHIGGQKSDTGKKIEKVDFGASEAFNLVFNLFLAFINILKWLVEQDVPSQLGE